MNESAQIPTRAFLLQHKPAGANVNLMFPDSFQFSDSTNETGNASQAQLAGFLNEALSLSPAAHFISIHGAFIGSLLCWCKPVALRVTD